MCLHVHAEMTHTLTAADSLNKEVSNRRVIIYHRFGKIAGPAARYAGQRELLLHLSFSHLAQFMCWELYIVIPPLQLHTIECSRQLKRRHYLDRELLNNLFRELKWHYIRPPPYCDAMIHMRSLFRRRQLAAAHNASLD